MVADVAEIVGVTMQKMGVAPNFRARFARVTSFVPNLFLTRLPTMLLLVVASNYQLSVTISVTELLNWLLCQS